MYPCMRSHPLCHPASISHLKTPFSPSSPPPLPSPASSGLAQGYYVPQSLIDREGNVLDADLVLNEVAADGDQFVVEVSEGPAAFTTR